MRCSGGILASVLRPLVGRAAEHGTRVALAPLRRCARPGVWLAALVAALCAPLSDIAPPGRAALADGPAFSDIVNVSENPGYSSRPKIAGRGDLLYVVWNDSIVIDPSKNLRGPLNVLFRPYNLNQGKLVPGPTVKVTDLPSGGGAAISSQVAIDPLETDSNVYVAWTQSLDSDVWFRRSTDNGATFGPPINLSKSTGTSFAPRIAVAGKTVFVAWGDFTDNDGPDDDEPGCPGGNFDLSACRFNIYVATSVDGGQTFGAPVNVSGRPSANSIPAIAATRSSFGFAMAFVTWSGTSRVQGSGINIFFKRSDDDGITWEGAQECSGDPDKLNCTAGRSKHPQVAASKDDVYVAWAEGPDGDEDIHIISSRDRATFFGQEFKLSNSPGVSDYPELAISPGGVQVVWHDGSTGVMAVFHSRSTNNGEDYTPGRRIGVPETGFTFRPRVATSGNNVHVIWSNVFDVYYGLSTNNGLAFNFYQLSGWSGSSNALRPRLAPSGSFASMVWDEGALEPLFTLLPRGERDIMLETTLPGRANLAVLNLDAIQAPFYGRALAKGKPTVLRVMVQSQFTSTRTAKLKLTYDTLQGGVPTPVTRTESVTLTPGVNVLYLPGDSLILPGGTELRASATVDPDHEIDEVDEQDNTESVILPVKDTGHLRVLYLPVKLATEAQAPTCDQVRRVMDNSHRFMRATYPIEPSKLHSRFQCSPYISPFTPPLDGSKTATLIASLEGLAKLSGVDLAVGVVREGWFKDQTTGGEALGRGLFGPDHWANLVEASLPSDDGSTAAHEIGHNLGWVESEHPSEDPLHRQHLLTSVGGGYWVTERRELKGLDFMRFAPVREIANWISADTYDFLMNALIRLNQRPDPQVILLRGAIAKDGAATLEPWYRFESLLDVPLNNPGAYTVAYLDAAGQPLGETGFDLAPGELTDGGGPLDKTPFSRLIPDVPGTRKIALKKGSQVLAERAATASSPTVRVLGPNGGERFKPGDTLKVTWESADADGNALEHAVLFSRDAGQTWLPLTLDHPEREFSFTVQEADATKDARVKVLVTDGFNGAEDSSDAGFSIGAASGGLTFGPGQMVRDNVNAWTIMATARTAASGDNVYAVWSERTCQPGCFRAEVLFRRSTDRGTSFDPLIKLSTNGNPNETPTIAVSGNNVYVAWNEDVGQIALRRSTDGGATFDPIVTLSTNLTDGALVEVAHAQPSIRL